MKHYFRTKIVCFFLFVSPFIITSYVQAADYLFSNTAPVAVHKTKKSAHNFPHSKAPSLTGKSAKTEQGQKELFQSLNFAIVLEAQVSKKEREIDEAALNYRALDRCKEDTLNLEEVFHHTEGSEAMDLLIYDPRYPADRSNVKKYQGMTVPWDPLYSLADFSDTVDAHLQELSRVLAPECLPVRFRFVYIGSKRYQEIRYGKKAWEKTE